MVMKKIIALALLLSSISALRVQAMWTVNDTPFRAKFKITHESVGNSEFWQEPGTRREHKTSNWVTGVYADEVVTTNIPPAWTPPGWKDPNQKTVVVKATGKQKLRNKNGTWTLKGPMQGSQSLYYAPRKDSQNLFEKWNLQSAPIPTTLPHYIYPAGTLTNGANTFVIE